MRLGICPKKQHQTESTARDGIKKCDSIQRADAEALENLKLEVAAENMEYIKNRENPNIKKHSHPSETDGGRLLLRI